MKLSGPNRLNEQKKKHTGGCFVLTTGCHAGLSRGINLYALPFGLSARFPAIGNNVYLLPLLGLELWKVSHKN